MANIEKWSQTDASNTDSTKSGMPEGMPRSDVNDRNREHMGALRRWFQDAEWVDLTQEHGADFTVTRVTSAKFRVADNGGTNASSRFPVDTWVKLTGTTGTSPVYGRIITSAYVDPNTDVTLADIVNSSYAASVVPSGTITALTYFARRIRAAAFSPTGNTTGETPQQIPTIDDLDDHVLKDEGHDPEGDGTPGIDADLLDGEHKSYFEARDLEHPKNVIINGSMEVWQRGTSITEATELTNDDANYIADRWVLLSDGDDKFDASRESTVVPTGFKNSIKLLATGTTAKGGILQIVEGSDCRQIVRNGKASLSFWARVSSVSGIANIRASILSWRAPGVEDLPTKDVVNSTNWGGAGTDPTLVTNWHSENTPASIAITDTFARVEIPNIAINSGALNLAVCIWIDDVSYNAAAALYISGVQLETGTLVSDYNAPDVVSTISACQRYFQKTYDLDVTPGTADAYGGCIEQPASRNINADANDSVIVWQFMTRMRIPALDSVGSFAYSPETGVVGKIAGQVLDPLGTSVDYIAAIESAGETGMTVKCVDNSASRYALRTQVTADAELGA